MRALTLAKLTSNGRYGRGAGQLRGGLGLGMRNCGGCQPSCSGTTMRPRPNAENDVPSNVTNDRAKRNRFMFHWTAGVKKCSRIILIPETRRLAFSCDERIHQVHDRV